jgi:hypothetical protein
MRPFFASILVVALAVLAPAPAVAATFRAPVEPATIEPGCDYGDTECLDTGRRHAGVDYLPDDSDEPILASADGVVRIAARAGSDASHDFGNVVVLEHTLPNGDRVSTVYAHLREAPAVAPGDCVARGSRLGAMGRTGAAANVHLHFEVKERPILGPPYGYVDGDPDDFGFRDPKLFVDRREVAQLCVTEQPEDPDLDSDPGSDCAAGDPRSSLPAVARSPKELRSSGRVRRVPAGCRVQVMLERRDLRAARCAFWRHSRRRMEWRACDDRLWTTVGTSRSGDLTRWAYRFRARLVRGEYELAVRLVDRRGRVHIPAGSASAAFSLR